MFAPPPPAPSTAPSQEEVSISREMALFEASRSALKGEFYTGGHFDKSKYWLAMRSTLPIHYSVYLADCASKKAASANVETVFSGAGKLAEDATTMHDDLLGAYVCNHVNWECEWLRPTVHDVACSYLSLHGADGADHGDADDEDEEDAPF